MRKALLTFACGTLLVFVACVGDDPQVPAGTITPDGGTGSSSSSSNSTSSSSGSSGTDSGLPSEGGTEACARVVVSTLAGTGGAGEVDGPGNMAKFDGAEGIAARDDGTLVVVDHDGNTIRSVTSDGVVSTLYTGSLTFQPIRVVVRAGSVHFVDRRNDDIAFLTGTPLAPQTILTVGAVFAIGSRPVGGPLYFTQTQNCLISTVSGGASAVFTGTGTSGCAGFADGNQDQARFSDAISDFAFDEVPVMYVADTGNFRIRKIDETTRQTSTLAGSTQGYADGVGDAAKFQNPTGIAVDPESHIVYVADETRVRAITKDGLVTTLAGAGSAFVDGTACDARFGKLRDIAYFAGALYAVDVNRIRKITLPPTP